MRRWMILILTLLATGCSVPLEGPPAGTTRDKAESASRMQEPQRAALPDYGPAPELQNAVWLNTEGPLRLADLRGRVVLLEMWTFG